MLPSDAIIRVPQNHSRDRIPHTDAFQVGCETTPEAVPTFPINSHSGEPIFHFAAIEGIKIESLSSAVREDWS